MRKFCKRFFIIIFAFLFFTSISSQVKATDPGYHITNYNIIMKVNENNTFDITEAISVDFSERKHGIIRNIPIINNVKRLDGTSSTIRARITDISVNEDYVVSNSGKYKAIRIGKENETVKNEKRYIIKYKYDLGKDPLKESDEFYFNLIGAEWDTSIDKVTFSIQMPKEFDESKLGFSKGKIGSIDRAGINFKVVGNTIIGSCDTKLKSNNALTVRLTLPEDYFQGENIIILNNLQTIGVVICISFVLIAFLAWFIFGRDKIVVDTVEFNAPGKLNPLELSFIYEGKVKKEAIISLLIYLAHKGYLKIEEYGSDNSNFTIRKLKDYDGKNTYERMFFNGMFKSVKDFVKYSDLHSNFDVTIYNIKKQLGKFKNKSKVFNPISLILRYVLIVMAIITALLSLVVIVMDNYSNIWPMIAIVMLLSFWASIAVFASKFAKYGKAGKTVALGISGMALVFFAIPISLIIRYDLFFRSAKYYNNYFRIDFICFNNVFFQNITTKN